MLQSQTADVKSLLQLITKLVPRAAGRTQRRQQARDRRVTLAAFLSWAQGHFKLLETLEAVPDGREATRVSIPLPAVLLALLCMFWLNLGSLKALDDRLQWSPALRQLLSMAGWNDTISDDTFADALERLGWESLRDGLHVMGKRELLRWKAGRYLQSELGKRLKGTGAFGLASQVVVAVDGHELFMSEHRCCADCLERAVSRTLLDGTKIQVTQYYHRVVVAQWVGAHPAMLLDFEPQRAHDNELSAAYRLVERLGKVYGKRLGVVVADAMFDCEPFRRKVREAGYYSVIRHKDERREPGRTGKRQLDRHDPARVNPDSKYVESPGRRYALWGVEIPEGARRYVEVQRTVSEAGRTHTQYAAMVTDLPADQAPLVAVAMIYEERWWIENTGFHQLVMAWSLDRAFVHAGRPTAARAIVTLALMAFNAFQVFVYRHLGWPPGELPRSLRYLQLDFMETLGLTGRQQAHARSP